MSRWVVRQFLVGVVVLFAFPPACSAVDGTEYLVLEGGRLIDGRGGPPVNDAVVVIKGPRILYAGASDEIEMPSGAAVIDVGGLTILPGFVNAHVHRGLAVGNLERWAWEGVTTVRDLGCSPSSLRFFREMFPPVPERARLVAAGPLITVPDGYPIVPFGASWATTVTSVEDAREVAEGLLDNGGADVLKLVLETGTVFGLEIPVMTRQQGAMLVRVAHGRGTVASAHITSARDLDLALDVGADDLAHMATDRPLSAVEIARVVAENVVWVPTLELWRCTGNFALAMANLSAYVAGGGIVALGTDYEGYDCPWQLGMPMLEIELMREAGMTPSQIIVAATATGARVCGLGHEIGTLETGKVADLMVVDGNPLADLEALGRVQVVVHDGVVVRNELADDSRSGPRLASGRVGG